jgi:hypothetical protein
MGYLLMSYIRLHPLKVPILLLGISLGYVVNQVTALWKPTVGANGSAIHQSGLGSLTSMGQAKESQTSSAQKNKDLLECYELARAKTGIDPKALGLTRTLPNGDAKPAKSTSEALTQAARGAESRSARVPAEQAADKNQNQGKLDMFNAANQACMQARGYSANAPRTHASPDEK